MIDVHYASLTSQGVQHREIIQMVTHPDINPIPQGLTSVNGWEPVFPFGDSRTVLDWVLIHAKCSTVTMDSTMWFSFIHAIPFFTYHIE